MSATTKIAVGVASGYLLGRTKKLRLAITVGSMLAGQRLSTNPQALLAQGAKLADKNPALKKLQEQLTGRLMEAAKAAALPTATSRLEAVTKQLTAAPSEALEGDEDVYDEEAPEDEYEEEGEEEEAEPEDEYDEGEE